MRDLAATRILVENGTNIVSVMAPPAFCASNVSAEEIRTSAKNGTFSADTDRNVLRDLILSKGYQSRISRTKGRLTAIGLLIRARVKKRRERK